MFTLFRSDFARSGWLPGLLLAALAVAVVVTGGWTLTSRAEEAGEIKSYQLKHMSATEFAARLKPLLDALPQESEVRIDEARGRVMLRGDGAAHRALANLLSTLDRAAAVVPQPARLAPYRLPRAQLERSRQQVEQRFPPASGVRVSLDERNSQLLVLAPQAVHDQIARMLPTLPADAAVQPPTRAERGEPESRTVDLRHVSPPAFEAALARLWRTQLPVRVDPETDTASLAFEDSWGEPVRLRIDRRQRRITVEAVGEAADAWSRLIAAIDRPAANPDEQTELVAFGNAERGTIQLALTAFQADGEPVDQQPADPPIDVPAGEVEAAVEGAGQIGPVRIEFLEGLDVIVVRGSKQDVARVLRIIEDIERLSAETQPAIEIIPLRFIDSQAAADLIGPLYEQVLQPRQGRVSITALVKPNALLLIGRQDSVQSVVELIRKLDEPIPPASQFRVFRLKYLSALEAQETITEFYADRGGLGPRLQILADFRTNSLVVRGGQRDLAEVGELLGEIDVLDSEAVSEVRVFPLRNSLAEELGPVLQEAIRGAGTEVQGDVGAGAQPGGGQQPGGVRRPGQQQARAAMLTLSTLDAEGKRLLQSGILTDVRIVADTRANALVVTSPKENMDLISVLIEQLDMLPAAESQIKVFTIINGDATALTEMLQSLFGQQTGGQAGPAVGAGGESLIVPLRFSVDQRTNSIIASGSSSDLIVVEAILLRLDESDVDQRRSEVYRLQNAPALDVANAINEYLRSERQVQQLADAGVSPFEQIEREVIVVPEPVNNSLIISATPRYFDDIMQLVRDLDKQPPMVLIQVLIAEVQLGDIDELGVELGIQDSLLYDRGVVTDTVNPGFNFNGNALGNSSDAASQATRDNVLGQALSTFGVSRSNAALGYGGLVLSASSDAVNVLVRALQDDRRLDILSRPQVMTLDNQPAFVQIGARVPRITSTQLTDNGTINNTVLENVGILLGVTPRISPQGLIVMEIDAEKSEVGPEAEGIPISINSNGDVIRSPQIRTITAQTTVSARNGQTVILGGLISKSRATQSRRVPILGDVPLLGSLFRFDSTEEHRRELLIIMTPYIANNESDLEMLKQKESQRLSWCLADVVEVHGNVGLAGKEHYKRLPDQKYWPWRDHVFRERRREAAVIYPDYDPWAKAFVEPGGRGGMPAVFEDQGHL
ncbi:MAG: secretin N-terminal domain-containing protein, partial [Pirellulales bacterium]